MIQTGLVSVSFRNLSVDEVVLSAAEAGVDGIEWGGDVHIPAGNKTAAEYARKATEKAGLSVFAYGSYYRAGDNANPAKDFLPVLECAKTLNAPLIRIWAGSKWSWQADEAYVSRVIEDTQTVCDMAQEKGIKIAFEYHGWSLTDNRFSAVDIWSRINRPNMFLYWQPNFGLSEADNQLALSMVLPHMEYAHVFYWDANEKRFPLDNGERLWKKWIAQIRSDEKPHCLMLEFFKDDSLEQFKMDAKTLKSLISFAE